MNAVGWQPEPVPSSRGLHPLWAHDTIFNARSTRLCHQEALFFRPNGVYGLSDGGIPPLTQTRHHSRHLHLLLHLRELEENPYMHARKLFGRHQNCPGPASGPDSGVGLCLAQRGASLRSALGLRALGFAGVVLLGCSAPSTRLRPAETEALSKRVEALEKALDSLALRTDSATTGLERLSSRLDSIRAPSAQWLRLDPAGVLRWYLDEDLQNVYARFSAWDGEKRLLSLSMTSRLGTIPVGLRVGESREITLQGAAGLRRFLLAFHHIATLEDGSVFALCSFSEGVGPS